MSSLPPAGVAWFAGLVLSFAGACRNDTPTPSRSAAPAAAESAASGAMGKRSDLSAVPASFGSPTCTVDWTAPVSTPAGKTGVARLRLRAADGFHVNQEAPFEVLVASRDVQLPRAKLGFEDATVLAHDEIQMEVPFSATAPGEKRIAVQAKMGMCSNARCAECRQRRELSTRVD